MNDPKRSYEGTFSLYVPTSCFFQAYMNGEKVSIIDFITKESTDYEYRTNVWNPDGLSISHEKFILALKIISCKDGVSFRVRNAPNENTMNVTFGYSIQSHDYYKHELEKRTLLSKSAERSERVNDLSLTNIRNFEQGSP